MKQPYPEGTETENLGLSLTAMSVNLAENFIIIDSILKYVNTILEQGLDQGTF